MTPITITVYLLATLLSLTAAAALFLLWMLHEARRESELARKQLTRQQAYAQELLDALPFPVAVKDQRGAYVMLNAASQREGGPKTQAIGQTSQALPPGELFSGDGDAFHESSLRALESGTDVQREIGYIGNDGSSRVGLWRDCPIHTRDHGVAGSLGVLVDITGFRRAEQEARRTELGLRGISQHIPVVVFTVQRTPDRRYHLVFLAGDPRALFHRDADELQTADGLVNLAPLLASVHPENQLAIRQALRRAMRAPDTLTLDFRAYGETGLRWIHLILVPHQSPNSERQWSGYFIDTTHINMRSEALRVARDAAERASKAKADFLATMSHEIRTPMNGVIGMLELLGRTRLDPEQHELLHTVEDSASVLLQILNDVLDFSKLEAGNLRLDPAPFDLRLLVDNVASVMASHLHAKGLHLQIVMDGALAGMLRGDSVRIRQILLNLLNNAAKFTERGSVAIALRVLGDDGAVQRLRLSVTDTGIGIAADKQANLFTPFSQAESWTTRRYGGTGLGLAICRYLAQLMDGSIALSSQPGVGTTITVELPLPIERREAERPPGLVGRHAIVRLGSTETAAALEACLQALGLTVETIPPDQAMRTGLAANLLFVDVGDHQSPAAIAAQTIVVDHRDSSPGGPRIEGEQIHLGANPLKWQSVTRACVMGLEPLNSQTRHSADADTPAVSPATPDARRGRILVAEDHPVSQALIRRQLELLGWSCDVVGDGRAAFDALRANPYVLLITDCQMPLMNGYELTTAWRQHESGDDQQAHLPILAMTASALDGEAARCRDAGMDDCISKPVQLRQLQQKIEAWVPPETAFPPHDAGAGTALAALAPSALTHDMLQVLLETSRTDLRQLELATIAGDPTSAAQRLHRLLGALQWFSNDPVVAEGHQWLEALHAKDAAATLQKLPAYVDDLQAVLAELGRGAMK